MFRALVIAAIVGACAAGSAAAAVGRASDDPLQSQEWWLADVGASTATPPGPGVPITIVDSGVDPTHPEFAGRPDTTFLNDQTVTGREEFHGTAVASVAAAPSNGQGIVGIYPLATLQIFDASPDPHGISDFTATTGILAAADHCPSVINLSFGSTEPDSQLEQAILTAVHNGCLVVAAAGNSGDEGSPTTYPAAFPHVLTVAATDQSDQVTAFSTTSPAVDLSAPGQDITAAVPLTRDPSGYSAGFAGTSFAAPIVSAAAAWVWTVRPTLTASQLAGVLRASARDIGPPGFDSASGWGIVNVPAALTVPPPPPDVGEPNDDISEVKPGRLFVAGAPPLTTTTRPSAHVTATIDAAEDPRDVYRIWVPANRTVRATVAAGGSATARIWGPQTVAIGENVVARRRDLKGQSVRAGKHGFSAYVEVLPTGKSTSTGYTLRVTASRR